MNLFYNEQEQRLRAGWRVFLQFVLMLAMLFGTQFLLASVVANPGFLVGRVPVAIAFILSTWIAVRYLDHRPFGSLGVWLDQEWLKQLGVGLAMGGAAMGVIFLLQLAMGWISITGFGWERAWDVAYPLPLIGYLIGMLLVGFYEELMFRGYQIMNMIEGFTTSKTSPRSAVVWAILVSSVIFGVMHAGNANASMISTINIIFAGLVLALPYLITGSLAISTGLHAAWNFFQGGIFGLPVSGHPARSSLLQVRETGPDLYTGGGFGPEAGLTGIIGLILIILLVYQYTQHAGYSFSLHPNFKAMKR